MEVNGRPNLHWVVSQLEVLGFGHLEGCFGIDIPDGLAVNCSQLEHSRHYHGNQANHHQQSENQRLVRYEQQSLVVEDSELKFEDR